GMIQKSFGDGVMFRVFVFDRVNAIRADLINQCTGISHQHGGMCGSNREMEINFSDKDTA
ncbi:hypothetical protein, partial [Photobacterium sp. 1_MG-2023]|uniref:hypothetical protein n=1 Tax=Photobacterium sp. 1_MG-2023 TaxID=3062646 RepID=UPI0026E194FE